MPESRRVLIVEDEEGIAIHLSFMLKRIQCDPVGMLAYGEEAVACMPELQPDLVLMDVNLAGDMDGTAAARQIHERWGTPIIFLSAITEAQVIRDAQTSEPFAYLVKPIQEVDLRVAIDLAFYKNRIETRLRESEKRYRMLFETMTNGFGLGEVICDAAGRPCDFRFLALNPAFERMTGVNAAGLVGHTLLESLPTFQGAQLIEQFGRVALTGESAHFEFHLNRMERQLDIQVYSPQAGQFATIVEDITERRWAENELREREATLRESEARLRESYNRQKRSLCRMTILRDIDQSITTCTSPAEMSEAILDEIVAPGEVDAAVLFVPNLPEPGRLRGTGPLNLLRLAGTAGLPESVVDSSVLNWQMVLANQVFQTSQPIFINDLLQDPHPGAQALNRAARFHSSAVLPLATRGQVKGVLQFFHRSMDTTDLDWQTFSQSLALQTAIGLDHVEMLENLKRSNRELIHAYEETIKGWAQALELRDLETRGHAERVVDLVQRLAEVMGIHEPELTHLKHGALLHDVGKMAIPDSILRKTGPLNNEEWVTMRQHTEIAYRMLYNIEYLRPALDVVYSHHEKWDGSGYPRGLKGEEIPMAARMFAVVDVWDALTSTRHYRLAWPIHETRKYIIEQAGRHFDPRIVEAFLNIIP